MPNPIDLGALTRQFQETIRRGDTTTIAGTDIPAPPPRRRTAPSPWDITAATTTNWADLVPNPNIPRDPTSPAPADPFQTPSEYPEVPIMNINQKDSVISFIKELVLTAQSCHEYLERTDSRRVTKQQLDSFILRMTTSMDHAFDVIQPELLEQTPEVDNVGAGDDR